MGELVDLLTCPKELEIKGSPFETSTKNEPKWETKRSRGRLWASESTSDTRKCTTNMHMSSRPLACSVQMRKAAPVGRCIRTSTWTLYSSAFELITIYQLERPSEFILNQLRNPNETRCRSPGQWSSGDALSRRRHTSAHHLVAKTRSTPCEQAGQKNKSNGRSGMNQLAFQVSQLNRCGRVNPVWAQSCSHQKGPTCQGHYSEVNINGPKPGWFPTQQGKWSINLRSNEGLIPKLFAQGSRKGTFLPT